MSKSSTSQPVKAPLARISFAQYAFKPMERTNDKGEKYETYESTFLFEAGTDLSALQQAALAAAQDKWGDKAVAWLKEKIIKSPFLDGGGLQGKSKKTGEFHPGMGPGVIFIRTSSRFPAAIVDQQRRPIRDAANLPSGCLVYPVLHAYAWDNPKQGKGISFGTDAIQLVRDDGTRYGGSGGVNPDDYFEKLDEEDNQMSIDPSTTDTSNLFG